jgi:cell division protein FtsW (lipid II flippase)
MGRHLPPRLVANARAAAALLALLVIPWLSVRNAHWIHRVRVEYCSLAAQILAVLVLALVVETRAFGRRWLRSYEQRAAARAFAATFIVGEAAALTSVATGRTTPFEVTAATTALVICALILALVAVNDDLALWRSEPEDARRSDGGSGSRRRPSRHRRRRR